MMVYVMRHGHAEAVHRDGDAHRELTPSGRIAIGSVGSAFAAQGFRLQSVIASPFLRTQQTAEEFVGKLDSPPGVVSDRRLASGAHPDAMMEAVAEMTLPTLVVGHMPDVSSLTAWLIGGDLGTRLVFEPGTMACIRVIGGLRRGSGSLSWLRPVSQW